MLDPEIQAILKNYFYEVHLICKHAFIISAKILGKERVANFEFPHQVT